MKQCRCCSLVKPLTKYGRSWHKSVGKYYLRSYCKKCLNKLKNIQRMASPTAHAKLNEHRRDYYRRNSVRMNKMRAERRRLIKSNS